MSMTYLQGFNVFLATADVRVDDGLFGAFLGLLGLLDSLANVLTTLGWGRWANGVVFTWWWIGPATFIHLGRSWQSHSAAPASRSRIVLLATRRSLGTFLLLLLILADRCFSRSSLLAALLFHGILATTSTSAFAFLGNGQSYSDKECQENDKDSLVHDCWLLVVFWSIEDAFSRFPRVLYTRKSVSHVGYMLFIANWSLCLANASALKRPNQTKWSAFIYIARYN